VDFALLSKTDFYTYARFKLVGEVFKYTVLFEDPYEIQLPNILQHSLSSPICYVQSCFSLSSRLRDYLYVYVEELEIEEVTDIVLGLPPMVLNMHSLPLWILAYNVLREKQTGDRRV
jgi:hypothetical protein